MQQQQQQQPQLNPKSQLSKHPAHCTASPTNQAAIFIKENVRRQGLTIENGRGLQFCDRQENDEDSFINNRYFLSPAPDTQSNLHVRGNLSFSYCLANPAFKPSTALCQKADDTALHCTAVSSLKCYRNPLTPGTAVFITQLYIMIYKFPFL